ncbi:leucine-rich repeat-containing protein [Cavenderia fasciculata]|uniref:Leucine-rich repeat-containing protein n=1 Tax=Cavenderia fasciculata TaxID=261658 RepID=F4PMM2_CACFS|nr:leucine-rich repeat-containing protein [Cavenderia fasciculata]EGG22819.1 leucine-rich repeat-containing protein [Cavenderia fasciculata]|eukprot:XP_004360670.1 leucine-rich repeat-containing protein [Cavenderia fasciculata]
MNSSSSNTSYSFCFILVVTIWSCILVILGGGHIVDAKPNHANNGYYLDTTTTTTTKTIPNTNTNTNTFSHQSVADAKSTLRKTINSKKNGGNNNNKINNNYIYVDNPSNSVEYHKYDSIHIKKQARGQRIKQMKRSFGTPNSGVGSSFLVGSSHLQNTVSAVSAATTPTSQANALVQLYDLWSGDQWYNSDNWLVGDPCNNMWYGITCNETTGDIIALDLAENNLFGRLTSDIADLTELVHLNIQNNNLNGDIPPTVFQSMKSLQILEIPNNQLSGDIAWTNNLPLTISLLWVAGNEFTGSIPLGWAKYQSLDLAFLELNQLTGTVPPEVGTYSSMRLFDIGFNNITGQLPKEIANLNNLTHFWAYDNQLEGNIPVEIGSMTKLEVIELTRNQMSGEIPSDMFPSTIPLRSIRFGGNNFTGNLDWICNLSNLQELLIEDNSFSILPVCSNKAPTQLINFVMSNNGLHGTIPIEFGNFTGLRFINLRQNKLFGSVPSTISNLVNLSRFDVSENRINCTLSEFMSPIKKLKLMSIIKADNNEITGEFSEDMFWDSDAEAELLTSVFIVNFAKNNISGPLSDYLSWMLSLSLLDLSNNHFNGEIPDVLNYLDDIRLNNNNLSSPIGQLPSFMKPSGDFIILENDNFECPTIVGKNSEISIEMDASYYNYSHCLCLPGYIGYNGSCSVCPENGICNGTHIKIPSGFFPYPSENTVQPSALIRCVVSNFGTTSCNPSNSDNFTCSVGYHDRLCARCEEGYYMRGSECLKCPKGARINCHLCICHFILFGIGSILCRNESPTVTPIKY